MTKKVTKCYTAFKIVGFGLMVRFNKLDVSLVLPDRSGSTRVTHERRSATKLTDTIPLYVQFRPSSVTVVIRLRAIIIKQ